jgi:hypothetical protein
VPGQPYERFSLQDRAGHRLTVYLSEPPAGAQSLPLVLWIQGEGCSSVFTKNGAQVAPGGGRATFVDALQGRARLLIADKIGIDPFTQTERCEQANTFNESQNRLTPVNRAACPAV